MIIFGKGSNCIAGSHQSILNTEIGKMISPWKHDVGEQEGWCFKHKMKYEMGGKGWGNNEAKRRLWSAGFTHKTTKMTWGEAARISVCFRLCTNEGPLTNTYGVNRLPDLVVWLSSLTQRESFWDYFPQCLLPDMKFLNCCHCGVLMTCLLILSHSKKNV